MPYKQYMPTGLSSLNHYTKVIHNPLGHFPLIMIQCNTYSVFCYVGVCAMYKECAECQQCIYYRGNEDVLLAYSNTLIVTL